MRHVVLAVAILASIPCAVADQPEKSRDGLLVDFLELSATDRTVPRDQSMVELVNASPLRLDVAIGPSGVSLEPGERVIARLPPGDVSATIRAPSRADIAALEGPVRVEGGHRYELAFGFGPVPVVPADLQPGLDDGSAPARPALAGEVAPKPATAAPAKSSPGSGKQKVQIGRKRKPQ